MIAPKIISLTGKLRHLDKSSGGGRGVGWFGRFMCYLNAARWAGGKSSTAPSWLNCSARR